MGKDSEYHSIADLRGTTIGISRPGSGSQTMAAVMAMQQGWVDVKTGEPEELSFKGLLAYPTLCYVLSLPHSERRH